MILENVSQAQKANSMSLGVVNVHVQDGPVLGLPWPKRPLLYSEPEVMGEERKLNLAQ